MPFHSEVNEDDLTGTINGVALEVHRRLGTDHPESTYRDILARGLEREGLDCQTEHEVTVEMYGLETSTRRLDLLVEQEVVCELKAIKQVTREHVTQLGSNVHAAEASRGLLLNFGTAELTIRRFVTKQWLATHGGGD
jgi:GxxExxY protein